MQNNLTEKEYKETISKIGKILEPQIKKLLNAFNEHAGKKNIRVGAEINWFIDKLGESK